MCHFVGYVCLVPMSGFGKASATARKSRAVAGAMYSSAWNYSIYEISDLTN
jgi:hypothetical protein